jgi:hypothetical protein
MFYEVGQWVQIVSRDTVSNLALCIRWRGPPSVRHSLLVTLRGMKAMLHPIQSRCHSSRRLRRWPSCSLRFFSATGCHVCLPIFLLNSRGRIVSFISDRGFTIMSSVEELQAKLAKIESERDQVLLDVFV